MKTTPLSLRALAARWFTRSSTHLGDDPAVIEALRRVLAEEGASCLEEQWGLAGSIELTITTFDVGGHRLVVEQETYEGVTLRGGREVVERIAGRVRALATMP